MKIGLYYEDKFTHELFECVNFTRCYYVWKTSSGETITEDKLKAWEHVNPRAVRSMKRLKNNTRNLQ
jgi:hypothetical protein